MAQVADFLVRMVFASVLILVVIMASVIGYVIGVEPIFGALSGAPSSLGWNNPGGKIMRWGATALLGTALTAVLWAVFAPIQRDRRQETRRP